MMQIDVKRAHFGDDYTISSLYIDEVNQCYVLEDFDRHLENDPNAKIAGETAIPRGTYKVIIDFSPHFNRELPHILDVPGYDGVRIHPGNSDIDTEGCLLVGMTWRGSDFIGQSKIAFDALFEKLDAAYTRGEDITITIS